MARVLYAWPFYLAYVVSFLTIRAAWLAHTAITDRLAMADSVLLRLNLLVLFAVSLLPFPTRLVAEGINDVSEERVFVAMYGVTLLGIHVLLYRARPVLPTGAPLLPGVLEETADVRRTIAPVVVIYVMAILIGLALPVVAVGLYCAIAVFLVVPLRQLARLLFARAS